MKVLVIGHLTGQDITPHLAAEGRLVAELRAGGAGNIRQWPGGSRLFRRNDTVLIRVTAAAPQEDATW